MKFKKISKKNKNSKEKLLLKFYFCRAVLFEYRNTIEIRIVDICKTQFVLMG